MSKTRKKNWKPTKTYEEYIEILKYACEELGRSITSSELEKHKYDLPSATWLVNNSKENIKTYNDLLESLGFRPIKKHNKHRKYNYEIASEEFAKRGFILLPQEYKSCSIPLKFICPRHPDIVQTRSLNSLIFGEGKCLYCHIEGYVGGNTYGWKGGTSSLNVYLRDFISEWKKESMSNCKYKCVITGDKFDDIHHLYSYNKILNEVLAELNLTIHKEINEYTSEELELLKEKIILKHKEYPLGVCLCKKVHDLYHHIYGDDNTPEQFEEFKVRYNNGEFEDYQKSKTKQTNNVARKEKSNAVRKLTSEQIVEIRNKYSSGNYTQKELGKEYFVGPKTISNIVNFRLCYR